MVNVRKDLSFKYVRGEGIEIGALHQSLPIPSNVKIHYVDRLEYGALLDQYPELSKDEVIRPDIIDDAYSLKTIKNESYDFCICNHVFEHMRDLNSHCYCLVFQHKSERYRTGQLPWRYS